MTLRTNLSLGIVGVLAVVGSALTGPAAQAAPDQGCANPSLAKATRASEVAKDNPGAFKAAEARNEHSVPGFAAKARSDRTLWLDRCLTAFYVDATASAGDQATATATMGATTAAASTPVPLSTVPLTDTFTLNSKPGSARTVYLDFKGGTITGTAWNNSYGSTLVAEPYSIDATIDTNFSDAELTEIQKVWQVVAEDYAAYDVNVTTQDPGAAAIDRSSSTDSVYGARALITNGGTIYTSCGCGGIAYVNVFNTSGTNHNYYQPAWVFSNGTTKNGKYIGEAASHEIGHNFGLNHDATSTAGYYSGSSPWAPIMGAAYSQPVSQWSKGEYPDANNVEDDLAIIATGAAVRPDEDPSGPLPLGNGSTANGVVTAASDADRYAFTAAGSTTVNVANAAGFPDLDVQLRILDANGVEVALVNPTTTRVSAVQASGMNASYTFTAPVDGALYTAEIRGAGQGTLGTAGAYSAYGSIGNYQVGLVTQTPTGGTPLSVSVAALPDAVVGTPYSATPVSASGGTAPYTYTASGLPAGLAVDASTGAVTGTPTTAGSFSPVFTVTDSIGGSASQGGAITVNAAPVAVADQSVSGNVGVALSKQLVATGGTGTYTWSVTGGAVPAGLTLGSNGVLSGTPTTVGTSTFSATATSGTSATGTVTVTIAPKPLAFVTASTLPNAKVRTAYSATISVTGGTPGYTWVRTSGSLPAGLSISYSGSTATITGTPTKNGKASFTLRVTDAAGAVVSRTFSIQVTK